MHEKNNLEQLLELVAHKQFRQLREQLENIWLETRKTIFLITHSVEEAATLARVRAEDASEA